MTEASLVDDSVYSLRIYLQQESKGYMEPPLTRAETESAAAAMTFGLSLAKRANYLLCTPLHFTPLPLHFEYRDS